TGKPPSSHPLHPPSATAAEATVAAIHPTMAARPVFETTRNCIPTILTWDDGGDDFRWAGSRCRRLFRRVERRSERFFHVDEVAGPLDGDVGARRGSDLTVAEALVPA